MSGFYDATEWVPANWRTVIAYWEHEGEPIHDLVTWNGERWYTESDAHIALVERWAELPYPDNASNPPSFDVIPL